MSVPPLVCLHAAPDEQSRSQYRAGSGRPRTVVSVPQCNVCMEEIDEGEDTHIEVVKPMEWKGDTREIRHYYCSVSCLLEQVRD